MYQQVPSSHVPKRKISSTNERKTKRRFSETPRDVSEGPEFHIEEAEVAMEIQEQSEGPEFTGNIRENRKHFLTVLKGIQLNKEESAYFQHEDLVILKFRSHKNSSSGKPKIVHLLTTAHKPALGNTTK